jgi:putative MATE family efflux protein
MEEPATEPAEEAGEPQELIVPPEGEPEPAQPVRDRVDLTSGNLLKRIALLSWPIVAASFLHWAMGVVDIKMVGELGPAAIAAVGTSREAIFTFLTLVFAVATGTQVLTARFLGAQNEQGAADTTRQAIILSVLCGAVLGPVGYIFAEPLMALLGAEGETLAEGTAYTRAFFIGTIPVLLNFMIISALRGAGDTLRPLYLLIGVNSCNVLFNWLLIFGVGPFPALGVAGAAWGAVISRTIAAIVLLWIVGSGRFAIHVPLLRDWRIDLSLWGKMLYIGVPSSIEGFARSLGFLSLIWILNQTEAGRLAVAGYTIAIQVRMFGVMFGLALMSAAMTAVSQNMGADSTARAEKSGWTVTGIAGGAMLLMGVAFVIFVHPLIGFFTTDPETAQWGRLALVVLSCSLPFAGVAMGFAGSLRGAGDTLSPLWATLIFSTGVGPGLAYVITVVLQHGPIGAWLGLAASAVLQAIMLLIIFKRGRWKQIEL